MKQEEREWCQAKYYEDINRTLDIGQLASLIQFGERAAVREKDLPEREQAGKREVEELLQSYGCYTEKIRQEMERYGEILQSLYFKTGVQTRICLQAVLLSRGKSRGKVSC